MSGGVVFFSFFRISGKANLTRSKYKIKLVNSDVLWVIFSLRLGERSLHSLEVTLAALAWGNARCTRLGERSLHSLGGTLAARSFSGTLKGFNIANPGCNPGLAAQHTSPTPTGLNIEHYKSYYSLILHNESYLTYIELTSYHPRTLGECLVITWDAEITSPAFAERVKNHEAESRKAIRFMVNLKP
jgi:hypothetical protein